MSEETKKNYTDDNLPDMWDNPNNDPLVEMTNKRYKQGMMDWVGPFKIQDNEEKFKLACELIEEMKKGDKGEWGDRE